jgi:hypothetical protein
MFDFLSQSIELVNSKIKGGTYMIVVENDPPLFSVYIWQNYTEGPWLIESMYR